MVLLTDRRVGHLRPGASCRTRVCDGNVIACLRASPPPKTHAWGLYYDEQGRITLYPVDSAEYARLSADGTVTQLRAMRSRRAG